MALYANNGEVEDGMRTLAAPQPRLRGCGIMAPRIWMFHEGAIQFDGCAITYAATQAAFRRSEPVESSRGEKIGDCSGLWPAG